VDAIFFTDGSLKENKAGFGVYGPNLEGSWHLDGPCSILSAELTAIVFVLEHIRELPPGSYLICSDSLSALEALKNIRTSPRTNRVVLYIRDVVAYLSSCNYSLMFLWIPSHSGISGNEMADRLAKHGCDQSDVFPREVESHDVFPTLRCRSIESWQKGWSASDLGRFCYSILPNVKLKPWFAEIVCSRTFIKNMCRLIANHYSQNGHLYRINITDSNLCDCGKGYAVIDHLVWECERFEEDRRSILTGIRVQPVRDILGNMDILNMKHINEFILKSKIKL
jgi:ribonuclease HI